MRWSGHLLAVGCGLWSVVCGIMVFFLVDTQRSSVRWQSRCIGPLAGPWTQLTPTASITGVGGGCGGILQEGDTVGGAHGGNGRALAPVFCGFRKGWNVFCFRVGVLFVVMI